MVQQFRTDGFSGIFRSLLLGTLALLHSTSVMAQSGQIIESESQLASVLCRNPTEEAANERLLNEKPQLLNVTLWNSLLNCASSGQHPRSAAESLAIYRVALRVAERISKSELVATSYYYLGRTNAALNDFENSVQAYETSRKLFEQAGSESNLGIVLADLGALYCAAEDYEKAQSYSEQSLAIARQTKSDPTKGDLGPIESGQAKSLATLGQIDLHRGNHAEALNRLREALALYEPLTSTGTSYNIQMAELLIARASIYRELGEYGLGFNDLTKAHQVSRGSGDQQITADIMRGQAALFLEQEDYAAADKYFNASLAIYRSLGNAGDEARVLLSMAVIKQRQGLYDNALRLFQQTMQRAQATNLVDVQIDVGEGLGVVLTAKRDFPQALNAINESLELTRRVSAKTREAELIWRVAQTYYAMQNYEESVAVAKQALALARALQLPKLTYWCTTTLGEAYAADGKIEVAISTLKDAVDQVEGLRDEVVGRLEGCHLFLENKVGSYHSLVKLLTKEGRTFEALVYAERAKSRVLLETVRNNRTDLKDTFTEGEKAKAESLINKLHDVKQRLQSQAGGITRTEDLQNQLNSVQGELVVFQQRLAGTHPELLLRTGPARPLTKASLNDLVRDKDLAYLEYVLTSDTIGIFILKRNGATTEHDLKYIGLPVNTEELREKVNEFHTALAERHPDFDKLGRELYQLLIAPVAGELQNTRTICIIPDEFLWSLPFQALITTPGNYFIQEHSLYYAPSFSVLNEVALRKQQPSAIESLIAFGNPVFEPTNELKQQLHPIPEAETEVVAVGMVAPTQAKRILVGRAADEKTFKTLASQYATIHLATHGLLDNRDPLNSFLVLSKADEDNENDGLLRAREIIDMHLDADLAVLSACETANGRISPGEGVIGMSWAFLVAGTRSVVVSQWRVNSGSTSQLMKNFYQGLARQRDLNGLNKSHALREASLNVLKDRRYRHPFYWASFVLVSSN